MLCMCLCVLCHKCPGEVRERERDERPWKVLGHGGMEVPRGSVIGIALCQDRNHLCGCVLYFVSYTACYSALICRCPVVSSCSDLPTPMTLPLGPPYLHVKGPSIAFRFALAASSPLDRCGIAHNSYDTPLGTSIPPCQWTFHGLSSHSHGPTSL